LVCGDHTSAAANVERAPVAKKIAVISLKPLIQEHSDPRRNRAPSQGGLKMVFVSNEFMRE
jgi:hypothetical protein